MLRLLFLPFHLAFWLIFGILLFPFLFLRLLFKVVLGLVLLPIVLVVACLGLFLGAIAFAFAILVPLAPIALFLLFIWAITRRSRAASVFPG